jgi:hypothetical protein
LINQEWAQRSLNDKKGEGSQKFAATEL